MKSLVSTAGIIISLLFNTVTAQELCLEGICIGDDVDQLSTNWKDINLTYDDRRFIETELDGRTVKDLYYDYNEVLKANSSLLRELLPYVIRKQSFDSSVLASLAKVKAICSSLTMTGEVELASKDRIFVTFRAVADEGKRGKLRVVRLEKQYNIMAPHLRPADADKYKRVKKQLKQRFPNLVVVRDIDSRMNSSIAADTSVLLGFRFFSSVSNPLVLRMLDPKNIKMIEYDDRASAHCQVE